MMAVFQMYYVFEEFDMRFCSLIPTKLMNLMKFLANYAQRTDGKHSIKCVLQENIFSFFYCGVRHIGFYVYREIKAEFFYTLDKERQEQHSFAQIASFGEL